MRDAVSADPVWQAAFEHSPIGMALVSLEGRWLAVNSALCTMLGYPRDRLDRMTFQEITHVEDLATDLGLLQQCLSGERSSYRMRKRYLRGDGTILWGDLSVALVRDGEGQPQYFISQILDVTAAREDRERLAEALAEVRHHRLVAEAVFASVDVGLVQIDNTGRYVRMNQSQRRFIELAFPDGHEGMAGQLGEVYHRDGITRFVHDEMPSVRASQGEEFDDLQMWVGRDPATRRALSVSSRCVRDGHGEFVTASLAYKDVTDLVRALQVKDEFVASVSHELRTPLTSVLGHLELLLDETPLDETSRLSLEVIERNARRLKALVSDLLAVAADSRGEIQLDPVLVDLAEVVREAVAAVRPEIDDLELTAELPQALEVVADGHRIRQVADNLISNAVKYTEPGGHVRVRLESDHHGGGVLTVADSGIGFTEEDRAHLFVRFYRSDRAREAQVPGTGLGLSIVKSIVTAHGGEVQLDSAPGAGSVFRVWIPGAPLPD